MYIGKLEKEIYKLREESPLILPQLDPDKYNSESASEWFKTVQNAGISVITIGGSTVDAFNTQEMLDVAIKDYGLSVIIYLSSNPSSIRGIKDKTAVYWGHVPCSSNTFYGWDGLIANALSIQKNQIEPIPTVYVFDDRQSTGTANWITRSNPIPREKPGISLAIAKAAEYLGIRFYIMAGGSGSLQSPPLEHVSLLTKKTNLFVIPTSGINTPEQAREIFSAGGDAIHIGSILEKSKDKKILNKFVKLAKEFEGREFYVK